MKTTNSSIPLPKVALYLEKSGYRILADGTVKDYMTERETSLSKQELTELRKKVKWETIYRVWNGAFFRGFSTESDLEELKRVVIAQKRFKMKQGAARLAMAAN